jgi:hypothetical protein
LQRVSPDTDNKLRHFGNSFERPLPAVAPIRELDRLGRSLKA